MTHKLSQNPPKSPTNPLPSANVTDEMQQWEKLEHEWHAYLNTKYGNHFSLQGSSNSTVSDILCTKPDKPFYIDVKSTTAHTGQFVLTPNPDTETFTFSPKNKTPLTPNTQRIINYMNDNFDIFKNVQTQQIRLDLPQHDMFEWVQEYYTTTKNVEFFTTKDAENNFVIVPIDKLAHYFDISATYRVKRSGSSKLSTKWQPDFTHALNTQHIPHTFINTHTLTTPYNIDKRRFITPNNTYYTTKNPGTTPAVYTAKILSKTHNANVIFRITSLYKPQHPDDLALFERRINQTTAHTQLALPLLFGSPASRFELAFDDRRNKYTITDIYSNTILYLNAKDLGQLREIITQLSPK